MKSAHRATSCEGLLRIAPGQASFFVRQPRTGRRRNLYGTEGNPVRNRDIIRTGRKGDLSVCGRTHMYARSINILERELAGVSKIPQKGCVIHLTQPFCGCSCGGPTRTGDLQVMSLASYQLLHSAISFATAKVMRKSGTTKHFGKKMLFSAILFSNSKFM